jgi:hypothetical protein
MRDSYKIQLCREDGALIDATLLEGMAPENLRDYAAEWQPVLQRFRVEAVARRARGESCSEGQDTHWDWAKLAALAAGNLSVRQFVIEADGMTQGLMQVNLVQRSRIEPGQHLLYVDRLAAAPWNRGSFGQKKRFRPVGLLLMRHAIGTSFAEGFEGRLGLHALSGAVRLYQRLSMKSFGPDADHHKLEYFELPADKSIDFSIN